MAALALTSVVIAPVSAVLDGVAGVPSGAPGLVIASTVVQDAAFVVVAILLALRFGPVGPRDFGLRSIAPRALIRSTLIAGVAFFVFSLAYAAILSPDGTQDTLATLGADRNLTLLVLSGLLVVVVAPFAEEVFFRGFFYRALRNRFRVAVAVLLNAVLFGAIHFDGAKTLVLLPVLAVLGATFCLLYERTGSLYPSIALHAINNAVSFGASDSGAPALGLALGLLSVGLCIRLARPALTAVGLRGGATPPAGPPVPDR